MPLRSIIMISVAWLVCANNAVSQQSSVELVAVGTLAGDSLDLSDLSGFLETGTPANQLGGFSAIDYSGEGNRYFVLSDRGPGDGAASFACRFHEFDLQVDLSSKRIHPRLLKTTLLKNAQGSQLTGALQALTPAAAQRASLALDSEAMRVLDPKTFALSDEYGPSVGLFGFDGKQQRRWKLPTEFALAVGAAAPLEVGTYPNRGLEGLALSADGTQLVAAMQGPLVQDGVIEGEKCLGLNTRWLVLDRRDPEIAPLKQLAYPLTDESTGVSEVLAVDAQRFLVLERDSRVGSEARIKHIYLADIRGATDVTFVPSLNRSDLPASVRAISKTLLIDLRDDRFGLGGEETAEKPEGLCWGPNLPDGRRMLMICVDNDFEVERKSDFYAFAISL
jgi:hypothetical protein